MYLALFLFLSDMNLKGENMETFYNDGKEKWQSHEIDVIEFPRAPYYDPDHDVTSLNFEDRPLTPEEFAKSMKDISDKLANPPKDNPYYDEEDTHMEMDDLMLDLLRSLGYGDGVDIFENTDKWYS